MSGGLAHHRLTPAGEIESTPAGPGLCIPYLIEVDGQDRLCVAEGAAFHTFDISPLAVMRLASEAVARIYRVAQLAAPVHGVAHQARCIASESLLFCGIALKVDPALARGAMQFRHADGRIDRFEMRD